MSIKGITVTRHPRTPIFRCFNCGRAFPRGSEAFEHVRQTGHTVEERVETIKTYQREAS